MASLETISEAIIKKLSESSSKEEEQELVIAWNAYKIAQLKYNEDPGTRTAHNMTSTKDILAGVVSRLTSVYFPEESPTEDWQETFKNPTEVWQYLKDSDWKIGRSQVYEHVNQGLLRKKDGVFLLKDVNRYAKQNLKNAATGQKVNEELDKLQTQKFKNEVRASELKLEKEEHDLNVRRGRYIKREEHELAIVGRAIVFMAHMNHTVQEKVEDWIDLVGGDLTKAPDLVAEITGELEIRMSDFTADAEFDVLLEGD